MATHTKRVIQLDGLRFVAVAMIFIAHWVQTSVNNSIFAEIPFIHGVTLFFVLSGYLITKSLFDNLEKPKAKVIKTFYIRRFLRIFPIYYLLLLLLYFLNFERTQELFPWLISYTTNIYQSISNENILHLNHLWSLAVEEQFYLFWPFVILFLKPSNSLKFIVLIIILSIVTKILLFIYIQHWMATSYFTLSAMHALGLGAIIAYLAKYKGKIIKSISTSFWIYSISILYVILLYVQFEYKFQWYKEILDEFFFAIICSLIISKTITTGFRGITKKIIENRFIVYLGKISYGLYLYHLLIPSLFKYISTTIGFEINNKFLLLIVYLILTISISHLSWKIIETPINRIKNKFKYTPSK